MSQAESKADVEEDAQPTRAQIVLGASVVGVILVGLVLAAWPAGRKLLWTQEAAAWVQALGSIAAIGTAIWLAHSQAERDQVRRENENFRSRVRNTSIALGAVQYIRFVGEGIRRDLATEHGDETLSHSPAMAHRITALRAFAERLDVAHLDNAKIAPRYFGVLEAVVRLDAAYVESPRKAKSAADGILEICRRFSRDFDGGGAHQFREYLYLPEFRDQ